MEVDLRREVPCTIRDPITASGKTVVLVQAPLSSQDSTVRLTGSTRQSSKDGASQHEEHLGAIALFVATVAQAL